VIQHGVAVYDGKFDLHYPSALSQAQKARNLLDAKRLDEALAQAQSAVETGPEVIDAQTALGDALSALGRKDEAKGAYLRAVTEAQKLEPAKQVEFIPSLRDKLAKL
jgi:tetratricopeptide (TPR) repeat protein